ncbi:39S ribosomal protein L46, mitochondrial-like [Gigantopelta aegis]|uniref:39S ribosomal protein L46, mitochondrial-like n=1 Tax=Gigantopelta aegis TaxID=1735272 RepID=UPI001B88B56C|nr:39S ribosomal protein L46, mitochondrial-like [Gigantopelta aegis]
MAFCVAQSLVKTFCKQKALCLFVRQLCNAQTSAGRQWQLASAVCLERHPVITSEKTELEQKMSKLMERMELEYSLLSDHELRHKEDLLLAQKRKQEDYEETEIDASRLTALDLEDKWEAELKNFTPASRNTDADKSDDRTSVQRKLDRKLILIVKQQLGDQSHWVFPQGLWKDGESMRQTAERVLQDCSDGKLDARFEGNAPCGLHKYKFKRESENGVKIFFFRASYAKGNIDLTNKRVSDFLWVTKDELTEYLAPAYMKSITNFVIDL